MKRPVLLTALLLAMQIAFSQAPVITSFSPAYGGQWSRIDIKGRNFTNTTAVTFGGTPAAFFYDTSDSTVVAFAGTGASGNITVTTANGTGTRAGFTFVLPPSINSLTPSFGGYGDTVIIKGENYIDVSNIYFGDSAALAFSVISDSIIKAVIGNGTSGQVSIDAAGGSGSITGFTHTGPFISSFNPTAGGQGTSVKIRGFNFTGATSVSFGGFPATSFTITGDTLITAIVGQGGPGLVSVSTPRGSIAAPGFIVPYIKSFSPQSGTRGTEVIINGLNLTGTTAVSFGDSAAGSFRVISDTVISAIAGNGATGDVKVMKGNFSASSYYFYYYPFRPSVSSFNPLAGSNQTSVTIKGTNFTGTSAVRFGDSAAASFTVISDSVIMAVVGNGSSGYVFVTNNNFTDSLAGFSYFTGRPVIYSFSPLSGPVNTIVTIRGIGFNAAPGGNIVYFGDVKAIVTAASQVSLSVIVPKSANYKAVSVTNNGLTGYSDKPFIVTFPGAMSGFSALSFSDTTIFKASRSKPQSIVSGDFSGDGKTDIAVMYGFTGTGNAVVSAYKNTGNNNFISFAPPVDFIISTQNTAKYELAAADMDGDGKLDIVALNSSGNVVSVLRNNGSPGNISFAAQVNFVTGTSAGSTGTNPVDITIHDFDGDGKPDIAVTNFGAANSCNVSYLRNTSANSILSFENRKVYQLTSAYSLNAIDLNKDNRPDIIAGINSNGGGLKQVATLNNISTYGNIAFNRNGDYGAPDSLKPYHVAFGDLNADGKPDMVTANGNTNTVSVFKNISADSGQITFSSRIDIAVAGDSITGVCISDADGDGKPDIIAGSNSGNLSIYKNTGSAGNISFAARHDYSMGSNTSCVIAADLSGDGKPDLVIANAVDTTISILKNNIGDAVKLCLPTGSTSFTSNLTGSSYQWQLSINNGSSFTNLSNSSNYSGVTTATLQLLNIPSSFAGYQYRCVVNGANSNSYKIQFENRWTGAVSTLWNNAANWSCNALPDGNTDVLIKKGAVVVNVNAACRSLSALPAVQVTVNPAFKLTVTH